MSGHRRAEDLFDEIENNIENVERLKVLHQDVIDRLRKPVADLKRKVSNLEEIEESTNAIREEILTPVSRRLEAGTRFSRNGYLVGVAGFAVSLAAIVISVYLSVKTERKVDSLQEADVVASRERNSGGHILVVGSGTVHESLSSDPYKVGADPLLNPIEFSDDGAANITMRDSYQVLAVDIGTDPGLKVFSDAYKRAKDGSVNIAPILAVTSRTPSRFESFFTDKEGQQVKQGNFFAVRVDNGTDYLQATIGIDYRRSSGLPGCNYLPSEKGTCKAQPSVRSDEEMIDKKHLAGCIQACVRQGKGKCQIYIPTPGSATLRLFDHYLSGASPNLVALRADYEASFVYKDIHRKWPIEPATWIGLGSVALDKRAVDSYSSKAVCNHDIGLWHLAVDGIKVSKRHFIVGNFESCGIAGCRLSTPVCRFLADVRSCISSPPGSEEPHLAGYGEAYEGLGILSDCEAAVDYSGSVTLNYLPSSIDTTLADKLAENETDKSAESNSQ